MDKEDKVEYAPKGMFPEDDEDSYEIELDSDLDVWNRGSSYTWGGGTSWWQNSHTGSSMSSMWSMGGSRYTTNNASRMLKHKTHIDSLCKITDPTVPHTLDFASHHTSGHTDMRRGHIVIDGSLVQHNDDKLDVLSGLAIHEKLHVIHSMPLMKWQNEKKYELAKTYGQRELLHSIANIVEDEYIERQLSKTCAGYVHYIEACKEHYFAKQEEVMNSKDLSDFSDLINTFLMLVRYPSKISMERRKRHAPHIRVMMNAIRNGIDSREATYTCIETVYRYLLAQAEKMAPEEDMEQLEKDMRERAEKHGEDRYEEEFGDFPLDDDQKKDMVKALAKDMFDRLMRRHKRDEKDAVDEMWDKKSREAIKDITEYISDEIDEALRKEINDLAESDYYETSIDKAIALKNGQRDITWQRAMPTESHRDQYKIDKSKMKSQISKLKKKLQLYGNLQKHNIYNQKRGILDKRQLHKIPMGMTDIFKATVVNEDKPLDICILVDESGSMGWHTMSHARQGAIAVKEALADNEKINLWVYGHSADETIKGQTDMIEYWSPTMKDRPMAMGGMKARYENRDGNAIVASADRIKSETDNSAHKLMIVMSDGAPSADGYRGHDAKDHTKKCVKHIEARGWSVIQVGFSGAYDWMMKDMFDNWVYVDDTDKLGDSLSKIIRKVVKI